MARTRTAPRLSLTLIGALLPMALLVGCTEDDPEPKFEESPSAEPSSDPTESEPSEPVEPTPPAAMEGNDEAAAKAFVEYYFAAWDFALKEGDTRLLRELGARTCIACDRLASSIDAAFQNSATITGGLHEVREVRLNEASGGAEGSTTLRGGGAVESTPQRIQGSGVRGLDGRYSGGLSRYSFVVTADRGRWQMAEWRIL